MVILFIFVTETHRSAPNLDTIRGMLSKMKGPVRFVDLRGKEHPCLHSPPPPAQPQQAYEPIEAEQRAAAHAARQHQQATAPTPIVPENTPTVDETAPKPVSCCNGENDIQTVRSGG